MKDVFVHPSEEGAFMVASVNCNCNELNNGLRWAQTVWIQVG